MCLVDFFFISYEDKVLISICKLIEILVDLAIYK